MKTPEFGLPTPVYGIYCPEPAVRGPKKTTLDDGYAMETFDIPLDLERRWEWIKFQLRVRGTNLAELARENGLNDRAIRNAKKRPYPSVERAIAQALGLLPVQLWPE